MQINRDDLELVRRVQNGDPEAIEAFGTRLSCLPRLVAGANHRLGARLGADEVSDLTQDVALLLWEKLETFQGRSTLEGWAWSYVVFQMRNRVRQVARHRRRHELDVDEASETLAAPSHTSDADREQLDQCLAQLPDTMADIIRLKHFQGLMFREIAANLSLPENTVKTRYYRALERVRVLIVSEKTA